MQATPKGSPKPKVDDVWVSTSGNSRVVVTATTSAKVAYRYLSGRGGEGSMDTNMFQHYFTKGGRSESRAVR